MCKNLVEKGNLSSPLVVYNRTARRSTELADRLGNCIVASSIADAVANADIIFSCLTDDKAVLETFEETLKHDVQGKLFVNCSTIQPDKSDELASRVEAKGAGLVTMPGTSYYQIDCNSSHQSRIASKLPYITPNNDRIREGVVTDHRGQ